MKTLELHSYKTHYKETIRLSLPIITSYIGVMATGIADSLMVGQLGTDPLAAVSLANNLLILPLLLPLGIAIGLSPIISKARGRKLAGEIQTQFSHGVVLHFAFAVIMVMLALLIQPLFYHLNQPEQTVTDALPYYAIVVLSILPFTLFQTFKNFAEGMALPNPGMVISLVGNGLNILLNYLLIFGYGGFPKMGVEGAAWATLIARVIMLLISVGYLLFHTSFKPYLQNFMRVNWSMQTLWAQFKFGFPIALQNVLEVGAFVVGALFIGSFGAIQLSAHHIGIQFVALSYRMSNGIATATSVRVSHALGEEQWLNMRRGGLSGIIIGGIFMVFMMLLFFAFSEHAHGWFVDDPEVIELGQRLLLIAAIFQVVDGVQVVAMGALRGMHDVNVPTWMVLVIYWIIMLPICYYLSIELEWKSIGGWWGYLIGISLAAVVLSWRFQVVSKRLIRENSAA